MDYKLISADSHLSLPPGFFQRYLPERHRDHAWVQQVEGMQIQLRPGGTIAGRVRGRLDEGEVLVQAFLGTDQEARFENGALVAPDGSFMVTNLAEGLYTLVAIGPGQRGVVRDVQVNPGGIANNIEIELQPHH